MQVEISYLNIIQFETSSRNRLLIKLCYLDDSHRFKQVLDLFLIPFQMYCTVYMMYILYLDVLYIWIKYCLHYLKIILEY